MRGTRWSATVWTCTASSSPAPGSRPWRPSWRCATSPATASRSTSSRPQHALEHRPASVAAPFGLGAPPPLDLHDLAGRYAVTLVEGELAGVDAAARIARLGSGEERGVRLPAGRRRREARVGAARVAHVPRACRRARRSSGCSQRSRAGIAATSSSWCLPGPRGRCRPTSWRSWRGRSKVGRRTRPSRWSPPSASRCGSSARPRARDARAVDGARDRTPHRRPRGARDRRRATGSSPALRDIADTVISLPRLVGPASPACPATTTGSCHGRPRLRHGADACSRPATPRLPDQAGRARDPAGRRRRRHDRPRVGAAVDRGRSRRCCAASCSRAGRRCTCAPSWTRRARSLGGRRTGACGRGLLARAVVAARQGRRPLPRALPVDGASCGARRGAARRSRRRDPHGRRRRARCGARARPAARRRGCGGGRPPPRPCTRSTRQRPSPAACCPPPTPSAARAGSARPGARHDRVRRHTEELLDQPGLEHDRAGAAAFAQDVGAAREEPAGRLVADEHARG